jgi:subtilisin-like proprotein convertase family protein
MICTFLLPGLVGRAEARHDVQAEAAVKSNPASQEDLLPYGPESLAESVDTSLALSLPNRVSALHGLQNDQKCKTLSEEVAVPEDGSWLQVCWVDPSAPQNAKVTETNVKILVDHPNTGQLEIRLTRPNSGVMISLSPEEITKEGVGDFPQIHDFNGLPSQGEWIVQIRDTVPGIVGRVKNVSIASMYTSEKMPLPISKNDGKPTSERITVSATRISGNIFNNGKQEPGELSEPNLDMSYSVPIMTQTFEGTFPPATGWSVFDANPYDGKEYYWDDDDYKHYNGSWAAWPANGGADGVDPAQSMYPANMDTWMIYGPFDLSNAKSANVAFMLWRQIELNYDHIFFGISSDGMTYNGLSWDGSADWENKVFDLNPYLGDDEVWMGWHFISDGSIQYEGSWIDEIMLDFEPSDVTVQGNFTYANRSLTMEGANAVKVQLWDWDTTSGNDLLAETFTDSNGSFSFPTLMNWDLDDTDPTFGNRRLDLYVHWVLENDHYNVTHSNGDPYVWGSSTRINISMGSTTFLASLPDGTPKFQALWLYHDIQRAREYYLSHTNPQAE